MVQLTETNKRKDLEHSLLYVIYLHQFISLPSAIPEDLILLLFSCNIFLRFT